MIDNCRLIQMLLAVDIGNTTTQLGLWEGEKWCHIWRARTVAEKLPDEYDMLIRHFLQSRKVIVSAVTAIVMSSVVPAITDTLRQVLNDLFSLDVLLVQHNLTGVRTDIAMPEQAGADRLANSAAVAALYGGPAIVIDLGTATNFDVISAAGAYIGGAIAPGMQIAHDALVSRAARLHKVEIAPPPKFIGRNTEHAMQSGIFWGYISLIEGMVARLRAELMSAGSEEAKIITSGGFATTIAKHLPTTVDIVAPNLLLDGLRVIHQANQR